MSCWCVPTRQHGVLTREGRYTECTFLCLLLLPVSWAPIIPSIATSRKLVGSKHNGLRNYTYCTPCKYAEKSKIQHKDSEHYLRGRRKEPDPANGRPGGWMFLQESSAGKENLITRETSVYLGYRVTPGVATARTGRPNKGALAACNNTRTFNRIRVQQNAVFIAPRG